MKKYLFWDVYINPSEAKSTCAKSTWITRAKCDPDSGNPSVAQLYYCKQCVWSPRGSCYYWGKHKYKNSGTIQSCKWNTFIKKPRLQEGRERENLTHSALLTGLFREERIKQNPIYHEAKRLLVHHLEKCTNPTISLLYDCDFFLSTTLETFITYIHSKFWS